MMSDAELRTRIADVHRDDAPPSFAALTGRARPRRRAPVGLLAIAAAGGFLSCYADRPRRRKGPTSELSFAIRWPSCSSCRERK
jgi:hypothetical protein